MDFTYDKLFLSLMAMVNKAAKNKVKKGKKGKKQQVEEEEEEPVPEEMPAPVTAEEEIDELDWVNDSKKGKKGKKAGKTESPAEPAPEAADDGDFRILTKKEKEKLKKEKLKEAKRLAALEKKKQQEAEDAEFNKLLGLEDKGGQQPSAEGEGAPQKSKKQLLKEKKAKKLAAKEAEPEAAPAAEEPVAPIAAPKGKKGKGGNVAALRVSLNVECGDINIKQWE